MPRSRAALVSLACALLIGTAACSSPDGDEPPASSDRAPTSATDEPIFASDEEALAAAVEAYEAYAAASARVANAGGEDSTSITPLVGEKFDETVQEEFAALRESQLRVVGEPIHYNARLDNRDSNADEGRIAAVFCRDISGTRLVRSDGSDVTPGGRDLIQATRVEFAAIEPGSPTLIVADAERIEDEEGC